MELHTQPAKQTHQYAIVHASTTCKPHQTKQSVRGDSLRMSPFLLPTILTMWTGNKQESRPHKKREKWATRGRKRGTHTRARTNHTLRRRWSVYVPRDLASLAKYSAWLDIFWRVLATIASVFCRRVSFCVSMRFLCEEGDSSFAFVVRRFPLVFCARKGKPLTSNTGATTETNR